MAVAKKTMTEGLEPVEEVKPVKKAKGVDPWTEMVEIRIPKRTDGGPNYTIASVNGKVYKLMNGVSVKVPAPIAEVIEHSFEAQDEAELYIAATSD